MKALLLVVLLASCSNGIIIAQNQIVEKVDHYQEAQNITESHKYDYGCQILKQKALDLMPRISQQYVNVGKMNFIVGYCLGRSFDFLVKAYEKDGTGVIQIYFSFFWNAKDMEWTIEEKGVRFLK